MRLLSHEPLSLFYAAYSILYQYSLISDDADIQRTLDA